MRRDGSRRTRDVRPLAAAAPAALLVAACLVLPASSFGAATIGSDLTRDPDPTLNNPIGICAPACTLSQEKIGTTLVAAPSAGVVVGWRVKTSAAISQLNFRVLRPAELGAMTSVHAGANASVGGAGVFAFDARVPVAAGDRIGVDFSTGGGSILLAPSGASPVPAGSNVNVWLNPKLGATETRGAEGNLETPPAELFLNATIEPDADADGHGDETQDLCPTDATRQTVCAATTVQPPATAQPTPARDVTPPSVRLARSGRQAPLRRKAVRVTVSSSEAGTARATGSISIPGRAPAIELRPATAALVAGVRTELKLRLTRRALRRLVPALARRRLRAKVTVETRDAAGNLMRSIRTVELTR